MNRRALIIVTAAIATAVFASAWFFYNSDEAERLAGAAPPQPEYLVRAHAPVMGPVDAPVTIVEFFDPSCESCRAFYPVVKQILARYPKDVRLVLRYAAFHQGSDEAVRILEAARLQNLYQPVLESVLANQPIWASHRNPSLNLAWEAAGAAGLNVARARQDAVKPEIDAILRQDAADLQAAGVKATPTFFVNGKPLISFGVEQLNNLVRDEVEATRKLVKR